ncbi:MAG: YdcF family protein [Nanoarchaeota archaeon]
MDNATIEKYAKIIWDYHHLNHKLEKADCIIVLGSHDVRVAERGAQLFLDGLAPILIFSGGKGRLTENWDLTEAEIFARAAIKMGVPKEKILIENRATNTGENLILTHNLLESRGVSSRKAILVQKPYMGRRTYATCKKVWPELRITVTSPQIRFEDYPTKEISKDDLINIMVGDLQRIIEYPKKGFQIHQDAPEKVMAAYKALVKAGYNKHILKE